MPSSILRRLGLLAAGLLLVAGCSHDSPTAPAERSVPQARPSGDLLGDLGSTLGLISAKGLQRRTPLAADITVVKTIGREGGTLAIPEAGVTVTVPYGALASPTQITMTARKGTLVAYDFAPHGVTFEKPLVFTQRLSGTDATLLGAPFLRLGYYADAGLLGETTALVSELLGGAVNLLGWTFTAPIKHFSGYIVTCGRSDDIDQ